MNHVAILDCFAADWDWIIWNFIKKKCKQTTDKIFAPDDYPSLYKAIIDIMEKNEKSSILVPNWPKKNWQSLGTF